MHPQPRLVLYTPHHVSDDLRARLRTVLASRAVPCHLLIRSTDGPWSYTIEGPWPPPSVETYELLSDLFTALGLP